MQALQFLIIVSVPLSAPLSRNCLHNHLLASVSSSCPQCVLLYTSPLCSLISPAKLSRTSSCSCPLSFVPHPLNGEWPLMTEYGLSDEMPLAHITSSCQLPLTSHRFCASRAVLPLFNAVAVTSHLGSFLSCF